MELSEALITGKGITLAEALSTGGKVTVLGLAIVFSVLIVLMLILMLFKVIFYKDPKKKTVKVEETAPVQTVEVTEPQMNEEELIAVITAAIAASLNTSTYNLQIKSYRRIEDKKPAWNKAGLRESINNRF
ncbi:MAG: OadG family transporter subunit [Clostridia bacterium]|nr:OadG family transporter subunit [Clostridia bacterium]